MAGKKEIRTKIASVKNTQKITRAMEMVAASKMRKAQQQMERSRPYAKKILQVIGHLGHARPDYKHPYMVSRPVKRVGVIIVSSDRGLCGGLNTNLFKAALGQLKKWKNDGIEFDLCTIGNKANMFFKRVGGNLVAEASHLGDSPTIESLIGIVKVMLDAYSEGRIDQLVIVYNRFINTMTQEPQIETLLPVEPIDDEKLKHHWDYIYEPNSEEVLNYLLVRYSESRVYQGMVENIACEQAARMVAMKNASENAVTLIGELQLAYNKARQASITQELSEIVSGAAAV
jgi:F-type H+-transporting ATPase subunit gamma